MTQTNSWDFTLANYDAVWGFLVQFGLLLLFLIFGNILRRTIPWFRKCLIPSALLGGLVLLVVNMITKQFDFVLVDNRLMQVITYHGLAIGFAAMTLKTEKSTHKTNKIQVLEFGALQGGTYMLQAFVTATESCCRAAIFKTAELKPRGRFITIAGTFDAGNLSDKVYVSAEDS